MNFESYFYLEYPFDLKPKITYTKDNSLKKNKFTIFKKYGKIKEDIKKKEKENKNTLLLNTLELEKELISIDFNKLKILLPFHKENYAYLFVDKLNFNVLKDKPILKTKEKEALNGKFKLIKNTMLSIETYLDIKDKNYCEIQKITYQHRLKMYYYLYDNLQIGGNLFTAFMDYCSVEEINLIYLLSLLFKKVIFVGFGHVQCMDFLGETRISKENYLKIIQSKNFKIEPKPDVDKLISYLQKQCKIEYDIQLLIFNKKKSQYLKKIYEKTFKFILDFNVSSILLDRLIKNYIFFNEKYHQTSNAKKIKKNYLNKTLKIENYLFQLIKKNKAIQYKTLSSIYQKIFKDNYFFDTNILQIGFDYGLNYNIFINLLNKLKKKYTYNYCIIDENIHNNSLKSNILNKIKTNNNELFIYEESPILALPKILNKFFKQSFRFIIIDKIYTLEILMNSLIFINVLLKELGFLIIINSPSPIIQDFIHFIENNYLHYTKIENKNNILVFKKEGDDKRDMERNYYYKF